MFESWRGLYADSPRALSERLAGEGHRWRRVWVGGDRSDFPADVEVVRRHSPAYFRELLTADLLFANDIITKHLVKGPRVTYVQTWHGTPLKLLGLDETRAAYRGARAQQARMLRDVAKWDYLVSPSAFVTEILRGAFGYTGPVLETGYPRNDILNSPDAELIRQRVRRELGIGQDKTVLLYAPTWRDDSQDEAGRFLRPAGLDAGRLRSQMPEDTVLMVRMHKNVAQTAEQTTDDFVVDVSGHPEIADLYLASDVLISDYSSAIYDYAVTGKPIVLFAYDLERYRDTVRGLYFDYGTWAPGPVVETTSELARVLTDLPAVSRAHADAYRRFVEKYCPLEDGRAGDRVLAEVLTRELSA